MSAILDPECSSPWLSRLLSALDRGHAVVLAGNLNDQQVLDGQFVSFLTALNTVMTRLEFDVVAVHDPVDEWVCADGSGSGERKTPSVLAKQPDKPMWEQLKAARDKARTSAPTTGGAPVSAKTRETVDVAVVTGRLLLEQVDMGVALIYDHVETWFSAPDRQSEERERSLVIRLQRMASDRVCPAQGPMATRGLRNALILITHRLAAVPQVLIQGHPLVSLVEVGRPTREDRLRFFNAVHTRFFGHEALEVDTALHRTREQFCDLTDGSTLWELEGLRRISLAEQLPVSDMRALINRYRHGRRDDPWAKLDHEKICGAKAQLERRVIGQSTAIQAMLDLLVSAKVGISMSDQNGAVGGKPKGVFFLVGPTGVGKTELAKGLTELVFGDESAFCRFDMSEYAVEHAAERLTGAPPGFVGYEEGGQLTNFVRQRPFSLLLFDEIEKGHGKVLDKFLAILEDGRLTDGKGQTAYFSDTVIVFTSNIGASDIASRCAQGLPDYAQVAEHFHSAVRNHFHSVLKRPEIHNRLGENVLVFDLLRPEHIAGIAWKFLDKIRTSAASRRHLTLEFGASASDSSVIQLVVEQMQTPGNMAYGGRRVKLLLETLVEKPLNRWIYEHQPADGSRVVIDVDRSGGAPCVTFRA